MRRVLLVVALVLVVGAGVLLVSWQRERAALGAALVADVTALKARTLDRVGPGERPTHDDALRCLAGMLDVTPGKLPPRPASAEAVAAGSAPPDEAVRSWLQGQSAWVAGVRSCSDAKKLSFVEGLTPWSSPAHLRRQRLGQALTDLLDFTTLEVPVLLTDGQNDLALERCAQTFSLFVDQSRLGLTGAARAAFAFRQLVPGCTRALAKAQQPSRAALSKEWSAQAARFATPSELVHLERVTLELAHFAAAADEAQRAALGDGVAAPESSFFRRLELGRAWAAFDGAMKKLEAVADTAGPARDAAVDDVIASGAPGGFSGPALAEAQDSRALLGVLAALAGGAEVPLPSGATRTATGIEWVDSTGAKRSLEQPPPPAEPPATP